MWTHEQDTNCGLDSLLYSIIFSENKVIIIDIYCLRVHLLFRACQSLKYLKFPKQVRAYRSIKQQESLEIVFSLNITEVRFHDNYCENNVLSLNCPILWLEMTSCVVKYSKINIPEIRFIAAILPFYNYRFTFESTLLMACYLFIIY